MTAFPFLFLVTRILYCSAAGLLVLGAVRSFILYYSCFFLLHTLSINLSVNRPSIHLLKTLVPRSYTTYFHVPISSKIREISQILLSNHLSTMHSFSTLLLPTLLFLSTTTAKHGPYIPSGSGSLPHYPVGTGAPYPIGTGTGHVPFPTGGGPGPLSSINPGGPIESAATCPLPTTVTTTTQVTVTVTVPAGGGATGPPYTIPGGGPGGVSGGSTGSLGTGTGLVGPTASAGLVRRMEMSGLGEEGMGRKERKRGFWG